MGKFSQAYTKAASSKPINDYAPNLGLGRHRVGIKFIRGKQSQKNKQVHIEAEFVVLESATERVGATRGWAWFINAPDWTGEYAGARLSQFMLTIGESVGSDQGVEELGDALTMDEESGTNQAHGIVLDVEVTEVPDKTDPKRCLKGKNGKDVHNAAWFAIPQGEEDIEVAKARMVELETALKNSPPAPAQTAQRAAQAQPQPQPQPQDSEAKPALTKSAGIKKLLGK